MAVFVQSVAYGAVSSEESLDRTIAAPKDHWFYAEDAVVLDEIVLSSTAISSVAGLRKVELLLCEGTEMQEASLVSIYYLYEDGDGVGRWCKFGLPVEEDCGNDTLQGYFVIRVNDGPVEINSMPVGIVGVGGYRINSRRTDVSIISADTFMMGTPEDQHGEQRDEVQHEVTLTRNLGMGKTEVTNAQMANVLNWALKQGFLTVSSREVFNIEGTPKNLLYLGNEGSQISYSGNSFVVESGQELYPCGSVTWFGALAYCHYRTRMEEGLEQAVDLSSWDVDFRKNGYRLPTEAEWEYACRAGADSAFYTGEIIGNLYYYERIIGYLEYSQAIWDFVYPATQSTLDEAGWYRRNTGRIGETFDRTLHVGGEKAPVGGKEANAWGLFDMHGNVSEWCWDKYDVYGGTETDPRGGVGTERVHRGGSVRDEAVDCRSASRGKREPTKFAGFRVVRSLNLGNTYPVANAGGDIFVTTVDGAYEAIVPLDASNSSDEDGRTVSYNWSWAVEGWPNDYDITVNGINPSPSFRYGTHTVTLTVIDDAGARSTDEVVVTVQRNIANAGSDFEVGDMDGDGRETVRLDGSESIGAGGKTLTYNWSWNGGSATGVAPSIVLNVGSRQKVTLTITDEDGFTDTDTVYVSVVGKNSPFAFAGLDIEVSDLDGDGLVTVQFDGSGSWGGSGNITSYEWGLAGGPSVSGVRPSIEFPVGIHWVRLDIETDIWLANDGDVVWVTVYERGKIPPVASAGSDIDVTDSDDDGYSAVILDASGSSYEDGNIESYAWTWDGGSASGANPSAVFPIGTHMVTLIVTGDNGETARDEVTVIVHALNLDLIASAGSSIEVTDSDGDGGEVVALDGRGSSNEGGSVVSYEWNWEGGTASGVTPSPVFAIGTHVVTLTVTDDRGATAIDVVTIIVNLHPDTGKEIEGFSLIHSGTFMMGAPSGEVGHLEPDETQEDVTISSSFYIGVTEVTNEKMVEVLNWALEQGLVSTSVSEESYWDNDQRLSLTRNVTTVSNIEGGGKDLLVIGRSFSKINVIDGVFTVKSGYESYPCVEIDWYGAVAYCNYRTRMEGDLGLAVDLESWTVDYSKTGYRLPTVAEWEYACRAGTDTAFYTGGIKYFFETPLDPNLDKAGWYLGNSDEGAHPVGEKEANAWGLYDMHGNVSEWCWTRFESKGPIAESSTLRFTRGGSSASPALDCRSGANRADDYGPKLDVGFRVVRKGYGNVSSSPSD